MSASYSLFRSCTRKLWKSTASSGSWSRRTSQTARSARTPSPKSGWAGTRIGTLQYYQLVGFRNVHTRHLGHAGYTGQAKEKLTMTGGSGIAMGFVGLLVMGVFLLVLVGLVVWLVARPRDRS